jgi:3,4-dihydroxy-9,10-secoandrosta-1,3,5(10)-triene-9,17-dione 4,5-dioxygenase
MSIHSLGYIVVHATETAAWAHYATDVVGLMVADGGDGVLNLKMDDRPFRIQVEPSTENRYGVSGWDCGDAAGYGACLERLRAAGVDYREGTGDELGRRKVQALAAFSDPAGNRHELFWGPVSDFTRFASPAGVKSFVTGELGMGHTVLPAPNFDDTAAFFVDVLGFGMSDLMKIRFSDDPAEPEKRLWFMHCNGRHHSLALFEVPMPAGCVHIMLEAVDIDEVGYAMDRMRAAGTRLTATLGRHANDHMISFYMATPGGFDLEFGAEGRVVEDWSRYPAFQSTVASFWGHDFSVGQQQEEAP